MDYKELNLSRRSQRDFDKNIKIERPTLERLLNEAALAPTSMNMQGYKVIAVVSDEEKKRLHPLAWNQDQVLNASAVFIFMGNLEAYKGIKHIYEQSTGVSPAYAESSARSAAELYGTNTQLARDEAIRSVGMFSMNLMLAAANAGYETCPMMGFDAKAVAEAYNIQAPYFPALMMTIGKVKSLPRPRGFRVPANEFTKFI